MAKIASFKMPMDILSRLRSFDFVIPTGLSLPVVSISLYEFVVDRVNQKYKSKVAGIKVDDLDFCAKVSGVKFDNRQLVGGQVVFGVHIEKIEHDTIFISLSTDCLEGAGPKMKECMCLLLTRKKLNQVFSVSESGTLVCLFWSNDFYQDSKGVFRLKSESEQL